MSDSGMFAAVAIVMFSLGHVWGGITALGLCLFSGWFGK
jgi:hypothetical protein